MQELTKPSWKGHPLLEPLSPALINMYERDNYNSMRYMGGFYDNIKEPPHGTILLMGERHWYNHRLLDRESIDEDDLHLATYNVLVSCRAFTGARSRLTNTPQYQLLNLHSKGTCARGRSDPTNNEGNLIEREWTFHERLYLVCFALSVRNTG